MNCIKDGKYTGNSCFGCKVYAVECEIRDKVYRNRWIPVSERLPERTERVIVTLENGMVLEVFFISGEFKFQEELPSGGMKKVSLDNPVVAWKPLPEPYKEVSDAERN